jgi:hypothetical protein
VVDFAARCHTATTHQGAFLECRWRAARRRFSSVSDRGASGEPPLVEADPGEVELRAAYDARYRQSKVQAFDLVATPRQGAVGARIVLIEFLDYG